MSNSVDPDETAHYEPSHLDLCCLQKPILSPMAAKELRVKPKMFNLPWLISAYHTYPKYWDISAHYHACPKI